jgi:heptosyltransferase-2
MAQPLLARLREKLPGARIDVVAPPWVAPVVRRMPEAHEVIEAPFEHGKLELGRRWKLGRMLAQRGYDQAIVLPNTWKAALVPFFADIALRSGYVGESRYGLLNLLYRKKQAGMPAHYAALAESPGKDPKSPLPAPRLLVSAHDIRKAQEKFGVAAPYAVLCPGAEYGPAKRWPYFAALAPRLSISALIVGGPGDREAAKDIPGKNIVGETTLEEALALIAGAAYVVTNDSGLMHAAAALGRPQVALFGSSSPEHTPPLSPAARVLWLRLECSPCFARECPLGHFRCMRELAVDKVLAEIHNLAS